MTVPIPPVADGRMEARTTDVVVRLGFLGLFVRWALELVRSFPPTVIRAAPLAVACHPAFAWLAKALGGRRKLAAATDTLVLRVVVLGPAGLLSASLVDGVAWRAAAARSGALILTASLIPIMAIDNVLKPMLMARGLKTPLLVILTGVIGGTLTHGLLGLFLGPVILAVFYELIVAWVRLGGVPKPGAS